MAHMYTRPQSKITYMLRDGAKIYKRGTGYEALLPNGAYERVGSAMKALIHYKHVGAVGSIQNGYYFSTKGYYVRHGVQPVGEAAEICKQVDAWLDMRGDQ
jgi:hypothetical protein